MNTTKTQVLEAYNALINSQIGYMGYTCTIKELSEQSKHDFYAHFTDVYRIECELEDIQNYDEDEPFYYDLMFNIQRCVSQLKRNQEAYNEHPDHEWSIDDEGYLIDETHMAEEAEYNREQWLMMKEEEAEYYRLNKDKY